jgi:DNA-binding SARP family transcriptional activator
LTLENCQVDTQIFLASCNNALQRAKHADPTATALLCDALLLWKGEFMPGICGSERVDLYRQELRRTHVAASRKFAALLVREGKIDKAALCLQQCALIDPGNDELIGELYRLLVQGHQLSQARQLLHQYSEQLHAAGFSRIEIVAALRCITDPAGEPQ